MSEVKDKIAEAGDVTKVNTITPRDVDGETTKPKLSQATTVSNLNPPRKEMVISRKSAPTKETVHMDMALPFIRNRLVDMTVPHSSTYVPSSYMMYFIIHQMDSLMCQNHHFLQNNIYFHPLISRIYYGILFYIQVLRCMNHANILKRNEKEFLVNFLLSYPPESLSIAGPLASFFQSITVSKSRFVHSGKITPHIPEIEEMVTISSQHGGRYTVPKYQYLLPNLYILFGSLHSLTSDRVQGLIGSPNFPKTWNPFAGVATSSNDNTLTPVPFNGLILSMDVTTWAPEERWLLASPVMAYPLESTKELDEKFSKNGPRLNIPRYSNRNQTLDIEDFTNLNDQEWFGQVMAVMTSHAKYFKLSTTLDKCSVEGPMTGQIICRYEPTSRPLVLPRKPGDHHSMFPLSFRAVSSNPELTESDQLLAFLSQLNISFPPNHPYAELSDMNDDNSDDFSSIREGDFWKVRPISMESARDTGYLQVKDVIQDHFFLDKPKN